MPDPKQAALKTVRCRVKYLLKFMISTGQGVDDNLRGPDVKSTDQETLFSSEGQQ
jgi:hypothetical protein